MDFYALRRITNPALPEEVQAGLHRDDRGCWHLMVQQQSRFGHLALGALPSAPPESPEFYARYLAPVLGALEEV